MLLTQEQIQKISDKCNHKLVAKFEIDFHFDDGHLNTCQTIPDFVQQELENDYTKKDIINHFFIEENFVQIVDWKGNYCDDCADEYLTEEEE